MKTNGFLTFYETFNKFFLHALIMGLKYAIITFMDADVINIILNATKNVLETMALIKPKFTEAYLKEDNIARGDVTGVVGLTGDSTGTISLTFDKGSILKIYSNMFGEELDEINRDVADSVGELTNIISGQARKKLEAAGKKFHGAIPTMITGENHQIIHIGNGPKMAFPFTIDEGGFVVEVCLGK